MGVIVIVNEGGVKVRANSNSLKNPKKCFFFFLEYFPRHLCKSLNTRKMHFFFFLLRYAKDALWTVYVVIIEYFDVSWTSTKCNIFFPQKEIWCMNCVHYYWDLIMHSVEEFKREKKIFRVIFCFPRILADSYCIAILLVFLSRFSIGY